MITKRHTVGGYIYVLFWILIAITLVLLNRPKQEGLWLAGAVAMIVVGIISARSWYILRSVRNRVGAIARYAADNKLDFDPSGSTFLGADAGSLPYVRNAKDIQTRNVLTGKGWKYCDFSYSHFTKTKYGDLKTSTVYYGVIAAELPRKLPHIFFDSLNARGRQFRLHFASGQRFVPEGGFDRHFTTYFPAGYTVDSLSIISPDVMWALQEADAYDVEIVGNRVLLYGPLFDPAKQIPDMVAKITKIKQELVDNILTYRDERLPYEVGRQRVAYGAVSLRRSRFWLVAQILLVVVLYSIIAAVLIFRPR